MPFHLPALLQPANAIATLSSAVLILAGGAALAQAQTRTFACGRDQAVTVKVLGAEMISAGPIEGRSLRFKKSATNPLEFWNGEYSLVIATDQTRITVSIPDFGVVKCAYRPGAKPAGAAGIGPADPCGPGFRQAPETDRCDPIPGNDDPNARPAPRTGSAEGSFPMEGRSFGGIVRKAPSLSAAKIASLGPGDSIMLLRRAGAMDGYDWFEIRFRGRTGYQWGGIMCSQNPIRGILQQCEP